MAAKAGYQQNLWLFGGKARKEKGWDGMW
jgi:hypothetical protein